MRLDLPILFAVTWLFQADVPRDEVIRDDLEQLQGKWKVVSAERHG